MTLDHGSAYWGLPADLRVEFSETLQYIHFYRTGGSWNNGKGEI